MKLEWPLLILSLTIGSAMTLPIITTKYGKVQGFTKSYPQGSVIQFLGIPFATPPVENLRFEKPKPHPGWHDTFNATQFGPSCMQYLFTNDEWLIPNKDISEDCLQLNIFIPNTVNESDPKAVMVWIHGGGFYAGQATLFDASYLALTGNVIVVTINYRLGLFGFLSTEDDVAPGNYGLWDQHMAIQWVKNNIAKFGGDTSTICIFGESAGGYSVGLHTVAAVNKGYFHRAISESGAVISPRALSVGARDVVWKAGVLVNCTSRSLQELLVCLKQVPANDLLQIQSKATESSRPLNFVNRLGPVIDGDFISDDPINILKNKNSASYRMFKNIDIMTGTNNAEGGLMYFSLKGFQKQYNFNASIGIPVKVLCDLVAPAVSRDYYNGSASISKAICSNYTTDGSTTEQSRSILDVYAHKQFVIPTIATNVAHASTQGKATYHYLFSHQPSFSWIQERPSWLKGVNHAGELPFVFGLHAMYKNESLKPREELELSRQIMVYWSNFAKTGNPNLPNKGLPPWPKFDTLNRRYIELAIPPKQGTKLLDDKYEFWEEIIPSLIAKQTSNQETTTKKMRTKTVRPRATAAATSIKTTPAPNSSTLLSVQFCFHIALISSIFASFIF